MPGPMAPAGRADGWAGGGVRPGTGAEGGDPPRRPQPAVEEGPAAGVGGQVGDVLDTAEAGQRDGDGPGAEGRPQGRRALPPGRVGVEDEVDAREALQLAQRLRAGVGAHQGQRRDAPGGQHEGVERPLDQAHLRRPGGEGGLPAQEGLAPRQAQVLGAGGGGGVQRPPHEPDGPPLPDLGDDDPPAQELAAGAGQQADVLGGLEREAAAAQLGRQLARGVAHAEAPEGRRIDAPARHVGQRPRVRQQAAVVDLHGRRQARVLLR